MIFRRSLKSSFSGPKSKAGGLKSVYDECEGSAVVLPGRPLSDTLSHICGTTASVRRKCAVSLRDRYYGGKRRKGPQRDTRNSPWRLHICILRKVQFIIMAYSRQKPLKMCGWLISYEGFSKVTSQPGFMKAGEASGLYLGKIPFRKQGFDLLISFVPKIRSRVVEFCHFRGTSLPAVFLKGLMRMSRSMYSECVRASKACTHPTGFGNGLIERTDWYKCQFGRDCIFRANKAYNGSYIHPVAFFG